MRYSKRANSLSRLLRLVFSFGNTDAGLLPDPLLSSKHRGSSPQRRRRAFSPMELALAMGEMGDRFTFTLGILFLN